MSDQIKGASFVFGIGPVFLAIILYGWWHTRADSNNFLRLHGEDKSVIELRDGRGSLTRDWAGGSESVDVEIRQELPGVYTLHVINDGQSLVKGQSFSLSGAPDSGTQFLVCNDCRTAQLSTMWVIERS